MHARKQRKNRETPKPMFAGDSIPLEVPATGPLSRITLLDIIEQRYQIFLQLTLYAKTRQHIPPDLIRKICSEYILPQKFTRVYTISMNDDFTAATASATVEHRHYHRSKGTKSQFAVKSLFIHHKKLYIGSFEKVLIVNSASYEPFLTIHNASSHVECMFASQNMLFKPSVEGVQLYSIPSPATTTTTCTSTTVAAISAAAGGTLMKQGGGAMARAAEKKKEKERKEKAEIDFGKFALRRYTGDYMLNNSSSVVSMTCDLIDMIGAAAADTDGGGGEATAEEEEMVYTATIATIPPAAVNKRIFTGDKNGVIVVWNRNLPPLPFPLPLPLVQDATDPFIPFVPESELIRKQTPVPVRLFPEHVIHAHGEDVRSMLVHNNMLYSAGYDGLIHVRRTDTANMELSHTFSDHHARGRMGYGKIYQMLIHDDYLYSCSNDCTIRVWSTTQYGPAPHFENRNTCVAVLTGHTDGVTCMLIHRNLLFTAAFKGDCRVIAWNTNNTSFSCKRKVAILTGHSGSVTCLAAHKNLVFSGSFDKSIRVWDIDSMTHVRTLCGHIAQVTTLCVNEDTNTLLSGGKDGYVIMWKL